HGLVEQWTQAREEICDRAAVAIDADPAAYSGFLLDIAATTRPATLTLLHMAASKPARRLKARIVAMLALRRVRDRVSPVFLLAVLGIMVAGSVLVSCVGVKNEKEAAPPFAEEFTELLTRVFRVPPDFLSDGKGPQDPFSGNPGGSTLSTKKTAKTLLTERGIRFPEGASAVFNPATSQLIVKNTAANMDRIAMELESLKGEREVHQKQVYVTTKWVEFPATSEDTARSTDVGHSLLGNADQDSSILSDPQFQVVMRGLSQKKGVNLMVAPSVTTRIGQRATVEVSRDFFGKAHAEAAAKGLPVPEPDFIGVRNDVLVQLLDDGYQLKLHVHADLSELAGGSAHAWRLTPGSKVAAVPNTVHLRKSKTATLPEGSTLVLRMGRSPNDVNRIVVLFVTVRLIDPSGKFLSPADAVQRARRAEMNRKETEKPSPPKGEKPKSKTIAIGVKTVDLRPGKEGDWLKALSDAIPMPPGATKPKNVEPQADAPKLVPAQLPQSLYTLAAVMTPEQLTLAERILLKRDDCVEISKYPVMTILDAKPATISSKVAFPDKILDGFNITVTPVIGADGYTIDLSIAVTGHNKGKPTRPITTAVTIFDGQTVAFGGLMGVDEKGWLSRLVFITAKMGE
ncbi:MAG: hypothetical protein ACOYMN_11110, partial [Roseimicrobium sp.]